MGLTVTTKRSAGIESDNLEAHVEICRQRYLVLEKRIGNAELDLNELREFRDQIRWEMVRTVGTAATIVVAVISIVTFLLRWIG